MLTGFKIIHVAAHTVPAYSYKRRFTVKDKPDKKAPKTKAPKKKKAPAKKKKAPGKKKAPAKMSTALVPYNGPIWVD